MICKSWNLLEKIPYRWTGQSNYVFMKKEINSLNKKCRKNVWILSIFSYMFNIFNILLTYYDNHIFV